MKNLCAFLLTAALSATLLVSCPDGSDKQAAAKPVASRAAGEVAVGTPITLTTATAGAEIWYTTDGSSPKKSAGVRYTTPIVLTANVTIKAIAVKDGMNDSAALVAAYTVKTHEEFLTQNLDAIWNDWLEFKYDKKFGWNAATPGGLKDPITHDMLAEEYFFAKGLNAGWNLGNTHDGGSNPRATNGGHYDKLMAGIKAAGINVIRIPVTWASGATGSGAETVVSASLLNDVEAAITEAHGAGLVVFINSHHDKSFFSLPLAGASLIATPDGTGTDFVNYTARFKAVWGQIAERFKDYGDWLIFEALNEPTINGPDGGTLWDGAPPAYHEVLNRWCQAFVDTVRETGGNNAKRYLIFKSYAGKLQQSLDPTNFFRIPTDPAGEGRLVYSFHAYIPQPLGLEGQSTNWASNYPNQYTSPFTSASEKYIQNGIPVFMGETGATFHSQRSGTSSVSGADGSSLTANRNRLLMLNALGVKARQFGVIPCLWDNGEATRGATQNDPNGETFAMFRRKAAHDNNTDNWGKPIDHTKVAGGSAVDSTGGSPMNAGNVAVDDPLFGEYTIKAFIDGVNGRATLGNPELSPRLAELYAAQ